MRLLDTGLQICAVLYLGIPIGWRGIVVPEWCGSAVGVLDLSGSVGSTVQLGHETSMVRGEHLWQRIDVFVCVACDSKVQPPAWHIFLLEGPWQRGAARFVCVCVQYGSSMLHGIAALHARRSLRSTAADPQTKVNTDRTLKGQVVIQGWRQRRKSTAIAPTLRYSLSRASGCRSSLLHTMIGTYFNSMPRRRF